MKTINIGLAGTGFAAVLHAESYKKVSGYDVRIKSAASTNNTLTPFCDRYMIPERYTDYKEMLRDPEIDIIDICTPPSTHMDIARAALLAGKHVVCEKPLTGFFHCDNADGISRAEMYGKVLDEMNRFSEIVNKGNAIFMYAENFIYTPAVRKTVEFLRARKNKIVFMRGEESHSGSHADHAAYWKYNGGGTLIRQGCHPLSAALYLKNIEAEARGEKIHVSSITADMGVTQRLVRENERNYIVSNPVDVEDQANVILTFSDGTKANIIAGDMVVGGVRNLMEVFTTESVYVCNMAPNDAMLAYHADDRGLENIYITEKLETKTGWQRIFLEEEISRGYIYEMQDFIECAATGRAPLSGFGLAYETVKLIYAAYQSDQEGRRICLGGQ